jgi:hypothetical protein
LRVHEVHSRSDLVWYASPDGALLVVGNLLALEGVWVSEALLLVKIA